MYYFCPDCQEFTEEENVNWTKYRPATLEQPEEHSEPRLPCCGNDAEIEAYPCEGCHKAIARDDSDYCTPCLAKIEEAA